MQPEEGGVQILWSLSEYFITQTGLFRGFTPQPPNNAMVSGRISASSHGRFQSRSPVFAPGLIPSTLRTNDFLSSCGSMHVFAVCLSICVSINRYIGVLIMHVFT